MTSNNTDFPRFKGCEYCDGTHIESDCPDNPNSNNTDLDKPKVNKVATIIFTELFNNVGMTIIGKVEKALPKLETLIKKEVIKAKNSPSVEELAKRLYVAKTEQRVIDCAAYGANCYAPPTLEDCLAELNNLEQGQSHD